MKRLRHWFRAITAREDFEAGMNEELRFHIEQYRADLERSGVSPQEAGRRARLEFGAFATAEEECREARGIHLVDELGRQLRYALRMLRRSPGFTATALLTLTICIAANLSIFAIIDSVLLRPLPFPGAAERLITVFNTYPKAGVDRDGSSLTNYYERREALGGTGSIPALESLALYRPGAATVGEPGATEREPVTRITPDFFPTLAVQPLMGRGFTEEELTYQTDDVAIVTYDYWRQRLQADPNAIGRDKVRIDGIRKTVVGVLPPGFRFLATESRIYLPLSSNPGQRGVRERHSGGNSTHMIARLKPGATLAEAQAQIDAHNNVLEAANPDAKSMSDAAFRSLAVMLQDDHVASIRPTLLLLQAGVLLLLVTGVVNLVNLLFVRANGRIKELALRQALGATQAHVLSEVLVETALLTILGGTLGFVAALAGLRLLAVFGAAQAASLLGPGVTEAIVIDARTGLVALAGSLLIGLILGAPIAWFNIRGFLRAALQSESRGGTSSRSVQALRHGFVIAQITLAFALLACAGLLAGSLRRAMAVSPGFQAAEQVLAGHVDLPWSGYRTTSSRIDFNERVLAEVARQPGVRAAGFVTNVPFSGNAGKSAVTVKGFQLMPGEAPHGIYSYGVYGDYFQAMGMQLLSGRFLSSADSRLNGERACVVDEDIARRYWPGANAIGQHLWMGFRKSGEGDDNELFTVVGVIAPVKQAALTETAGQGAIYYPFAYRDDSGVYFVVRTNGASTQTDLTLPRFLQQTVRRMDPDVPVTGIRSMEARISSSLGARRMPAMLAGFFSLIAVLLTAIGAYGVLSYSVEQRRREIGVRMALGAGPSQILGQFLALALRLLSAGLIAGLATALVMGRAMQTLLFQVSAFDTTALAGAGGILAAVSLAACLLPSRRAARISPTEALASE